MLSLKLFGRTFQRVKSLLQQNQHIKKNILANTYKMKTLSAVAKSFSITNFVEHYANDLQSESVQLELQSISNYLNQHHLTCQYDYANHYFLITSLGPLNNQIQDLAIKLKYCRVENVDHPSLRRSLYFHELKDIQHYVKLEYPHQTPQFLKDIHKKSLQNHLLDSQNPLGVPVNASPLIFSIIINNLFEVKLKSTFGKINIQSIKSSTKNIHQYYLKGMNLPRPSQEVLFDILKQYVNLGEPQLLVLHKLATIGGLAQQIQLLLDFHSFLDFSQ